MKKLKAWQIVLLVIFYPVGICVLIYRLIKGAQLKRANEETQRAAAEERGRAEAERQSRISAAVEADRELRRVYDDLPFKVVGVTFKNPDGRTRQAVLRKLKFADAPYDKDDIEITVEKGEYEGEPAFPVMVEGVQVGNIAREDIPLVLSRWEDFVGVTSFDVSGGGRDEGGYAMSYGLKINMRFRKVEVAAK